mgnify:CR=1 FL=1
MNKIRLDQLVFEKGFAQSREKARALIMSGCVFLDGRRADKPGQQVPPDAEPDVRIKELPFVSRGGYKLDKALRVFPMDPEGKICIDCGASTGGFTDVLLQHGALKVYAVDVGYGQLAWKLRSDPRVWVRENFNARNLASCDLPETPSRSVTDVSFISLKLILPPMAAVTAPLGEMVSLVKPQFEAGRGLAPGGVVKDPAVREAALAGILAFGREELHLEVLGVAESPIRGKDKGNIEYLVWWRVPPHA